MKNTVAKAGLIALLAACSLLSGCDIANKGQEQMKFIDMDRVARDAGLAAQQQKHLQQVHDALQQGVEIAQSAYASLPEDKVKAAQRADEQILNLKWQQEQNKARDRVVQAIVAKAEDYREENNLSAILPRQSALALAPELDITEAITQRLKETKVDFGPLPEITRKAEADNTPVTH